MNLVKPSIISATWVILSLMLTMCVKRHDSCSIVDSGVCRSSTGSTTIHARSTQQLVVTRGTVPFDKSKAQPKCWDRETSTTLFAKPADSPLQLSLGSLFPNIYLFPEIAALSLLLDDSKRKRPGCRVVRGLILGRTPDSRIPDNLVL